MTLPRSENLVSTMLSDTILALCRNTLQYKSEVCVEGLIGVTVDQKEVFLVHLNETILRDGGLSKSKRSDKLRKRQSEDVTDSSSESSDSKDSDSEHARSKRKRRRKRRRSKLKEVSEELAEQPKSLPTNENSQEAKDPANSDNLDKTTDSINSTRLSQPEKDSNSRNLKREKKDSDEDLVFVKEEPKEYTDNSSCSFGQSPFTLPGNPSGDSSQMYGGPPVGELGQLQEINMQMTNEQAMAINMSGQASTSSSSGGTPADQGGVLGLLLSPLDVVSVVQRAQDEINNENISHLVFAKAVLKRTGEELTEILLKPFNPNYQRYLQIIEQFLQLTKEERQAVYRRQRTELRSKETRPDKWATLMSKNPKNSMQASHINVPSMEQAFHNPRSTSFSQSVESGFSYIDSFGRRRGRTYIPDWAKKVMDDVFEKDSYISNEEATILAEELNRKIDTMPHITGCQMDTKAVKLYFQNKRARNRRDQAVAMHDITGPGNHSEDQAQMAFSSKLQQLMQLSQSAKESTQDSGSFSLKHVTPGPSQGLPKSADSLPFMTKLLQMAKPSASADILNAVGTSSPAEGAVTPDTSKVCPVKEEQVESILITPDDAL